MKTSSKHVIFTIGHSTHSLKDFLQLLENYKINHLVDVRTIARSRYNPQFNEKHLAKILHNHGIKYSHMKGLGGLRHTTKDSINTAWRNSSFRGFADYMQTEEFRLTLEQLIKIAKQDQVALMCAEALPWRCHRSLIADALIARKMVVEDIFSKKIKKRHLLTPWARVRGVSITYPG